MTGTVEAFDEHAGLGWVRDDLTGADYPFHCTAIADGTRSIAIGVQVNYEVQPGGGGRWEATNLRVQNLG